MNVNVNRKLLFCVFQINFHQSSLGSFILEQVVFFSFFEPIHGFCFLENKEDTKDAIESQCTVVVTMNNVLKGQRFGVLDGCPDILLLSLDNFQECLFMTF